MHQEVPQNFHCMTCSFLHLIPREGLNLGRYLGTNADNENPGSLEIDDQYLILCGGSSGSIGNLVNGQGFNNVHSGSYDGFIQLINLCDHSAPNDPSFDLQYNFISETEAELQWGGRRWGWPNDGHCARPRSCFCSSKMVWIIQMLLIRFMVRHQIRIISCIFEMIQILLLPFRILIPVPNIASASMNTMMIAIPGII